MSKQKEKQSHKQIVVSELLSEDKESVVKVLVQSYQQYEREFSDPQVWQEYLTNIKASVANPDVDKILVAKNGPGNSRFIATLHIIRKSIWKT
ncbi:hypothetical protein [Bacillus sp. T3]|uniref:hypothetical protein n=1 Tax=Bacillus sp. T3 TaxID=467262 RepID=UPI002981D36A|nr:hypothetical protein [Bacillus sp. T3]